MRLYKQAHQAARLKLIAETPTMTDIQRILLWPDGAPGSLGNEEPDRPFFTTHIPASKRPAPAVMVCPGGGYGGLAFQHEGLDIAAWLNTLGIAAFVLHYRLGPRYRHPAPLTDVQRAIRTVRHRAAEWNVDTARFGIWGFSAGGHLAATASTHFDAPDPSASDPIDRESSRPDFSILCYPVIHLREPGTHSGSRNNLLGPDPDPSLIAYLSNDEQVTGDTPPTFLFHTSTDGAVPVEHSVLYYLALRRAGVPAEMHIFQEGRHGLGLAPAEPALCRWPELLRNWLIANSLAEA